MNWNDISFLTTVLLAIGLFMFGLMRFWRIHWGESASLIKNRLRALTGELQLQSQSLVKTRFFSNLPALNGLLKRVSYAERLDTLLTQAGVTLNVGRFLVTSFLLWLVVGLGTWSAGLSFVVSMLLGTLPTLVWALYLQHQRRQRVFNIEVQLPDTLDLMARAMQAGHAFSSALLIVGTEGTHPIREEFHATFDEINFGITTEVALKHLTLRVASSDLRFFVVAVLIQLETGGNLTEILKSLASLIRDRQRIAGSVRVLTAEGRLSAWILGLLPFGIAMLLSLINPEFISKLWTDPMGIRMLQVSLGLMAIGIWWMWRMVRIRI
jgi:tight adherence protein B